MTQTIVLINNKNSSALTVTLAGEMTGFGGSINFGRASVNSAIICFNERSEWLAENSQQ